MVATVADLPESEREAFDLVRIQGPPPGRKG
jgi:hypothetical protein